MCDFILSDVDCLVASPGLSDAGVEMCDQGALVRELAKGLDVHFNVPVTSISLEDLVLVRTEDATYRGTPPDWLVKITTLKAL